MVRFGRLLLWASVLTMAVLALVGRASATPVQAPASFRAVASAEGIRTSVTASGAPLSDQVLDGASPLAQAELDSARGSTALASAAYPGDLVITAPGLVAGFTGGEASGAVPEYPLIAIAGSTTQPESRADGPGTSMRATTDEEHASAVVTTGTGSTETGIRSSIITDAHARIDETGVVEASASADVGGITIGPLTVGRVLSQAEATRGTDESVASSSTFEVTGLRVAGVAAKLTSDGLVVADVSTPVSTDALQPILEDAGIGVQVIEEERTDGGVVSAGLAITRRQDLPGAVTPATVTLTFGRVAVHLAAAHLPPLDEQGALPPTALDADGSPPDQQPAPSTASPGDPPPVAEPTPPTAPSPPSVLDPAGFVADLFDLTTVYLVLVAAAAAGGTVLELTRHLGVRLTWN